MESFSADENLARERLLGILYRIFEQYGNRSYEGRKHICHSLCAIQAGGTFQDAVLYQLPWCNSVAECSSLDWARSQSHLLANEWAKVQSMRENLGADVFEKLILSMGQMTQFYEDYKLIYWSNVELVDDAHDNDVVDGRTLQGAQMMDQDQILHDLDYEEAQNQQTLTDNEDDEGSDDVQDDSNIFGSVDNSDEGETGCITHHNDLYAGFDNDEEHGSLHIRQDNPWGDVSVTNAIALDNDAIDNIDIEHQRTIVNLPRLNHSNGTNFLLDLTDVPLLDQDQAAFYTGNEGCLETSESILDSDESPRGVGKLAAWGLQEDQERVSSTCNVPVLQDLEFYDAQETLDTEDTFRPRLSSSSIRQGLKEEEFDLVRDKHGVFDETEWHDDDEQKHE